MDDVVTMLADRLIASGWRVVLVESCTVGMAAALLGRVPGISRSLCGSLVCYRPEAKIRWLGISEAIIRQHTDTSDAATRALAEAALRATPEADLAGAITGHLGPDAPAELDGTIYLAVARRAEPGPPIVTARSHQLRKTGRVGRQREAALALLGELLRALD